MKLSQHSFPLFVVLLFMVVFQLSAQWSTNPAVNNAISMATSDQQLPTIVSDGTGGVIIIWSDYRVGVSHIYAQRINASGSVQWTADGVAICTAKGNHLIPTIVSDGTGGAIITWHDSRSGGNFDIYAQRINATGTVQWTADGVVICTALDNQQYPTIVSDGNGGAIITWHDYRNTATTGVDIYAQRINASGAALWTADGVAISTAAGSQLYPTMVSVGSGGAIITWYDYRNTVTTGADIYAQRINASGAVQWTADGVSLCVASGHQFSPAIVSDGSAGAIITWQDLRSGAVNNIYAQRINAFGTVEWTANGVPIATQTGIQSIPKIVSDGSGGAIITWEDNGKGLTFDIYAQKINPDGNAQWITGGVPISAAIGDQTIPKIVSDGSGGAVITWLDTRNGMSNRDIYAQKINGSGIVQWKMDGVAVCTALNNQFNPTIVSDELEGAIITWYDLRGGTSSDIYAQKIDMYGILGEAAPKLIAVKDIANDQGGKLRLFWNPSYIDAKAYKTIKSYTLKLGAKPNGIIGKTTGIIGSGIYWQTADIIRADQSEGYSSVVTTYADSGLQGIPKYYFQVIAKNGDSTQVWYSNIDSGYSVDNIPPVGVGGASIKAINNGNIQLLWSKNTTDKDLMGYAIYRSTTSGVLLNQFTKITLTTDTTYVDTSTTSGIKYYYKIAGIDIHGNIGTPSTEVSQIVLSVHNSNDSAPMEFILAQNYPNPFNPTTTIEFTVPVTGQATLKVFNAIGQEVATLFNGIVESGKYHRVMFDAAKLTSGIYFARIQFDGKHQFRKMLLVK